MRPHVEPPLAHHLCFHVPWAHLWHLSQLERSVSAILSLYAFILALPVKVLSMIVLILSRHSSLCGFVAFPCDASAAHPWAASTLSVCFNIRRQHVKSSEFSFWCSFNHNPWQWDGPAPSVSAVTFFANFNSGATICHGVPLKPSQFVDSSVTVCLRPTFASRNSILGHAQKSACSIMITNEDSLSHAACKRNDTAFPNFTKTKLCLQIAPLAFSIFDKFVLISLVFPSLPILILCHDLRCKTRKPTEQ